MLKNAFVCERCGECCTVYTVVLSPEDIKNIEALGFAKSHFAVYNPDRKEGVEFTLKRIGGKCIFLEYKDAKASCKIYEKRPAICKVYPFFQDEVTSCKPHDLVKGSFLFKRKEDSKSTEE
jgi:Fe-S-cluster containining protein